MGAGLGLGLGLGLGTGLGSGLGYTTRHQLRSKGRNASRGSPLPAVWSLGAVRRDRLPGDRRDRLTDRLAESERQWEQRR